MRLMFPPSCSGSFDALRTSAEGLKSGGTDRLAGPTLPVVPPPAPPPPAVPVSSRSLPSKELALLLTLSAGERPVGGSRHSREPGYCGGAVRMAPPEVEDGVVEDGGGQGVLRSRPGEAGSDLMLTLEFVLTVSMAPWGIWVTGLRTVSGRTERGRRWKIRDRTKRKGKRKTYKRLVLEKGVWETGRSFALRQKLTLQGTAPTGKSHTPLFNNPINSEPSKQK